MPSIARPRWRRYVGAGVLVIVAQLAVTVLPGCTIEAGIDMIFHPGDDMAMPSLDGSSPSLDLLGRDGASDSATPGSDATPSPVDLGDADALPSGVAQGLCHGCAWHRGRAVCWGANNFGQLGDDTRDGRSIAKPVLGLSGVVSMAVGC